MVSRCAATGRVVFVCFFFSKSVPVPFPHQQTVSYQFFMSVWCCHYFCFSYSEMCVMYLTVVPIEWLMIVDYLLSVSDFCVYVSLVNYCFHLLSMFSLDFCFFTVEFLRLLYIF